MFIVLFVCPCVLIYWKSYECNSLRRRSQWIFIIHATIFSARISYWELSCIYWQSLTHWNLAATIHAFFILQCNMQLYQHTVSVLPKWFPKLFPSLHSVSFHNDNNYYFLITSAVRLLQLCIFKPRHDLSRRVKRCSTYCFICEFFACYVNMACNILQYCYSL